MRFAKYVALAGLMIASTAGVTEATPISFTDTFDPAVNVRFDVVAPGNAACLGDNVTDTVTGQLGGECESLTYMHILQADAPNVGLFNPLTDTLASANLALYVYDDTGDPGQQGERLDYELDFGDVDSLTGFFPALSLNGITTEAGAFIESISVIALLDTDGQLLVELELKDGDLFFHKSILTARGERVQDVVVDPRIPEPGTLALLGLGAVAGVIRRRKSVI